jgi:hypothetical protein
MGYITDLEFPPQNIVVTYPSPADPLPKGQEYETRAASRKKHRRCRGQIPASTDASKENAAPTFRRSEAGVFARSIFDEASFQAERAKPGSSRSPMKGIANSTPIIPGAIAFAVWNEASGILSVDLPRSWIAQLACHAEVVFRHNPKFRARVCAGGNSGRDYLWSFMRHWLCGMLFEHDPSLRARLPKGYEVGRQADEGQN